MSWHFTAEKITRRIDEIRGAIVRQRLPLEACQIIREQGASIGAGAAEMIEQTALTPDVLESTVSRLLGDPRRLDDMREKTLLRARPDAAKDIAANILKMDCFK